MLALDAAAHFKMSDTEPCTVVEHFFQLVAPRRNVLSVALDRANMPPHLRRRLRVYYGADKAQTRQFWLQFEGAIAAYQADNSQPPHNRRQPARPSDAQGQPRVRHDGPLGLRLW